jgi:hypothetical protein
MHSGRRCLPPWVTAGPPLASLSPPSSVRAISGIPGGVARPARRPPRSVPRCLVKGVRFPDPRCLPSAGASFTLSHRGARGSRCLRRSPGVHVMRIARPRRTALVSPRAAHHARACRVRPFEARPPSTRSVHRAGFRPAGCRWRASLSLRASCRLLQTRRCTGIHRERVAPRTAAEGDDPSHAFAFGRPLAGTCTGDEPLRACFRRSAPARTGPTRAKVSFPLSRAESPSRTDPRTPLSCARPRGRADPFSPPAHAPGDSPRANALRITAEVSGPAAPREGRCVRRRPRCVPPSCVRANA